MAACLTFFMLLEQVIDAADEVIDSIDRDELAKYLSQKSVPEDDEEEVCLMSNVSALNLRVQCCGCIIFCRIVPHEFLLE